MTKVDILDELGKLANAQPMTYVKLEIGFWCNAAGKQDVRIAYLHEVSPVFGIGDSPEAAYDDLTRKLATGEE